MVGPNNPAGNLNSDWDSFNMKTRLIQKRNRFSSRIVFCVYLVGIWGNFACSMSRLAFIFYPLLFSNYFSWFLFLLGLGLAITSLLHGCPVSSEHHLPPPFWFISNETCHLLTKLVTLLSIGSALGVQNSLNCFYLKICRWIMIKVPSKVSASPKSETRLWKYIQVPMSQSWVVRTGILFLKSDTVTGIVNGVFKVFLDGL